MVPHGFRFNPTDEELIQILDRKASEQEMSLPFIIHANIYDREPQHLERNDSPSLGNDESYYYCKRENDSREVSGKGWWKATSHVKKVRVNEVLVGLKRPLTFHKYKDDTRNRSNAIKTNWIMHEFSLDSKPTDWRLCKIKYKGKPSMQEEMENMRQQIVTASSSSMNNTQLPSEIDKEQQQNSHYYSPEVVGSSSTVSTNYQIPQTPYSYPYYHNSENVGYSFNEQHEVLLQANEELFAGSLWSWQN